MTKDEFDAALEQMGKLSWDKTIREQLISGFEGRLRLTPGSLSELVHQRDRLDRKIDEISAALGADPTVDAFSEALDDDMVEMQQLLVPGSLT